MMWTKWSFAVLFSVLCVIPNAQAANKSVAALESLSADAYVWGYPLVLFQHTREAMLKSAGKTPLPENHFVHSTSTPEKFFQKFIPTNSENLYSWAWLDLNSEPLIFSQPAISNRYFSVQFTDAYTNVFQVISNESLSGKAATFALTSPTWNGDLPAGVIRIKATTPETFVLAQMNVRSKGDLAAATKLNNSLHLIPLSRWLKGERTEALHPTTPAESFKVKTNLAESGVGFLSELAKTVAKNPPPTSADGRHWQAFSKRLLSPISATEKSAIERGLFAGARQIEDRIASGSGAKVNGWSYALRAEPFREDYLVRAAVAQTEFFSTPTKEILHLKATTDSEDRQLYSNYKYKLHFNKGEVPPTSSGWTLRVFESVAKNLASVPVEKSRLNPQSPSLKANEDGSMDVYLQSEAPDKDQQGNWLPLSNESGFFVVLTIYNPSNSIINRNYVAPSLTRVDDEGLPRQRIVRTMMADHRFLGTVSKWDRPQKVTALEMFDR